MVTRKQLDRNRTKRMKYTTNNKNRMCRRVSLSVLKYYTCHEISVRLAFFTHFSVVGFHLIFRPVIRSPIFLLVVDKRFPAFFYYIAQNGESFKSEFTSESTKRRNASVTYGPVARVRASYASFRGAAKLNK